MTTYTIQQNENGGKFEMISKIEGIQAARKEIIRLGLAEAGARGSETWLSDNNNRITVKKGNNTISFIITK